MFKEIFKWTAIIFLCATILYAVAILYVKIIVDGMSLPGWRGKFCEVFNSFFGWIFAILILFSYLYYKTIGTVIATPAIDDFKKYKEDEKERFEKYNKEKERRISEQDAIIHRKTKENLELQKQIKEKEKHISELNEKDKADRQKISGWINEKNDLIERLTNRVQELEDQIGIDSGFDEEREERIRKLVMEKIHGKGTE